MNISGQFLHYNFEEIFEIHKHTRIPLYYCNNIYIIQSLIENIKECVMWVAQNYYMFCILKQDQLKNIQVMRVDESLCIELK